MAPVVRERLIAVYDSEATARRAAEAAQRAGAAPGEVRLADENDRVAELRAEMRGELEGTVLGPGNVGPWTPEMTKGMALGTIVGGIIGLLFALPFAAIDFGLDVWLRVLIVAIVGAAVGGTAGWVIGGGFGAKRPDEPLDAERGVTVSGPAIETVERAFEALEPIRIELVEPDGTPIRTVRSKESPPIVREIGKHMAGEDRDS